MKKAVKVLNINIVEFINTKDKTKRFDNFKDFLKEGSITEYCFKYTIVGDKENKMRISKRIVKLDLYNKEAYTINDKLKYAITNEIV